MGEPSLVKPDEELKEQELGLDIKFWAADEDNGTRHPRRLRRREKALTSSSPPQTPPH